MPRVPRNALSAFEILAGRSLRTQLPDGSTFRPCSDRKMKELDE